VFSRDGLNHLWNELMKEGELMPVTGEGSSDIDELPNSAGVIARRGNLDSLVVVLCILVFLLTRHSSLFSMTFFLVSLFS